LLLLNLRSSVRTELRVAKKVPDFQFMGVPENRIGIGNRGPEKWDTAPAVRICRYVSFTRSRPRHASPVQSCAPHSIGVNARSVDRTCHPSLAHLPVGTAHRSTTPNFVLVNRHRTILKPFVQWKLDRRTRRRKMVLCMTTGIFRRRFCSCLFSFVACCLSCVGWSRILRISLATGHLPWVVEQFVEQPP
jgi:hypothetical protein